MKLFVTDDGEVTEGVEITQEQLDELQEIIHETACGHALMDIEGTDKARDINGGKWNVGKSASVTECDFCKGIAAQILLNYQLTKLP